MSKIQETAVAIRECLQLQKLADGRSVFLRKQPPDTKDHNGTQFDVLATNAEQVCSDAGFLLHTFEQELTAYVPETPADMLTQALVLASYYNDNMIVEGECTDTVVRLLIGRLLEGLIKLAGPDSSPLYDGYFNPRHTWSGRVKEVRQASVREPPVAA